MHKDDELPIIRAFYEFIVWINPKIGKFPRDQRFTLGERMERQLYEVLENLLRAKYRHERKKLLEEVNLGLEILRFQIRLAAVRGSPTPHRRPTEGLLDAAMLCLDGAMPPIRGDLRSGIRRGRETCAERGCGNAPTFRSIASFHAPPNQLCETLRTLRLVFHASTPAPPKEELVGHLVGLYKWQLKKSWWPG